MAKTRLARSLNSSKKKIIFYFLFYLKTIFLKVIDYQFLKNTFNLYLPRFFCSLISTSFGSASPLQSGLCNNPPFILPIPPYPTLSYLILPILSYPIISHFIQHFLFCLTSSNHIQFVLSHFVRSYPVLSHHFPFYPIISYLIPSYPHC